MRSQAQARESQRHLWTGPSLWVCAALGQEGRPDKKHLTPRNMGLKLSTTVVGSSVPFKQVLRFGERPSSLC